jgi:hypothetical protein
MSKIIIIESKYLSTAKLAAASAAVGKIYTKKALVRVLSKHLNSINVVL